jgi:diguanylate cyclase (GGDEF)-like protein
MLLYQAPYFLMQAVAVGIIWSARSRGPLDNLLMAVLSASALQFLSKAFLFQAFGGTGATAQDYLKTNYALVSQSMGTVFAMAIALLMLVILVRDIFADVTRKSETDALSGLLNRGGFERQAEDALRQAQRNGLPVSLVISDIDHFKAINDTFGHAAGDRVIEAFAGFLRSATNGHRIAGRIGGEEFAIALPGTNLSGARLFAEGARGAFAALPIDGLPDDRRFTASFGVAELRVGESISDLMRRADEALYEAKKGGRDCVRGFEAKARGLSNIAG